uniref:Uncharacterized protein n=1 Tax=Glossina morsitans morsitans TaxID=37546 RepID=A0A1B0FBQ0_GLOMM
MEWGPIKRPMWIKFGPLKFYVKLLLRTNFHHKTLPLVYKGLCLLRILICPDIQNIDLRASFCQFTINNYFHYEIFKITPIEDIKNQFS